MINVILLAILQGVAEFLPISSSGHLVIGQRLLGMDEPGMRLDLMLHVGTLVSIFVFYRRTIWRIVSRFELKYAMKVVVSAIPACAVYYLFHDFVDGAFENPKMVGAFLMFTGAVLVGTRYMPRGGRDVSFWRAFLMGLGQALAILPGVSRSGMTLAAARAGRVDPEKSAEFSFLMSAPLILGGMMLDVLKDSGGSGGGAASGTGWGALIVGAAVAAVVGYAALALLVRALRGRWFWLFGPYCFVAGLLVAVFVG